FLEKDKRILEELKSLHCDPHTFSVLGYCPPDTPYENGAFELYCQFGAEYPVKPPLVRFVTPVYHCNVNSVGRICHNLFDRNYSAHITMKEVLDAVYGLLIVPEPEDLLDSSSKIYEQEAKSHSEQYACNSMYYMEEVNAHIFPPFLYFFLYIDFTYLDVFP
uniref:UBC core domain-containing protein n=1 Tax=Hucho hucho TaxID=62062 RepID=A0A4W5QVP1_9TELE